MKKATLLLLTSALLLTSCSPTQSREWSIETVTPVTCVDLDSLERPLTEQLLEHKEKYFGRELSEKEINEAQDNTKRIAKILACGNERIFGKQSFYENYETFWYRGWDEVPGEGEHDPIFVSNGITIHYQKPYGDMEEGLKVKDSKGVEKTLTDIDLASTIANEIGGVIVQIDPDSDYKVLLDKSYSYEQVENIVTYINEKYRDNRIYAQLFLIPTIFY